MMPSTIRPDDYPFCISFTLNAEIPLPADLEGDLGLGQSLRRFRLLHEETQREMAERIGCSLVSYQQWEGGKVCPLPRYHSAILLLLEGLASPKDTSVGESLKIQRLQRGLNLAEMARFVGLTNESWTRLEGNSYLPSEDEIKQLQRHSISLPPDAGRRENTLPTALSESLRDARVERGLSQEEVARQLGYCGGSVWSRIETSGRIPKMGCWAGIREILGVKVEDFIPENGSS